MTYDDPAPLLAPEDPAVSEIERLVSEFLERPSPNAAAIQINREAGHHPITTDPRELRAAFRAGERTWRRFPYYEQRYGERGRRFTRSDSAWIVTLTRLPADVAERHLRWLGELLATRGMPRWLLETHLDALHEELLTEAPEGRAQYVTLRQIAARMRDERLRCIDQEVCAALSASFDRSVGAALSAQLPATGALIVAAVCDERAGMGRAVESLLEWLADPARFPATWIEAVGQTVAAAREQVS